MGQQQANQKFNFIVPTDPYHPFYRMRVRVLGPPQQCQQEQ
jgi:hypothetical protein